jgi:hypothetical protein
MPVGPGEPRTVSGLEMRGAIWLPDSRRFLVFGREPGQPLRIFLVDADTGSRHPLPVEGAPTTSLSASPDGRRILADRADGSWALFPIEGGAPIPVSGIQKGEAAIRFTRDGGSVFVTRLQEVPLRVFRVDLATGSRSHWRDFEPADKAGLSYVRLALLSADASAYAYQYRRWLSELYVVEGIR